MKRHRSNLILAFWFAAAIHAFAAVRYVDVNSANPTPPYTNWATAATNIQDAVDAATSGDQILVTNGVYQTGGRVVGFDTTSRLAVDKPVTVKSVNGPQVTLIDGGGAMRCVYLGIGTLLTGFTLTNGFAGPFFSGGGVAFDGFDSDAVVSNCVIVNCRAAYGGGVGPAGGRSGYTPLGGTVRNSNVRSNSAGHGNFNIPGVGGGVYGTTLINCTLTGNSAQGPGGGGGASSSKLQNCLLTDNSASDGGGGAAFSDLINCLVVSNTAPIAGGASRSNLRNCIAYYNGEPNHQDCSVAYSCTTPFDLNGVGNITNAPLFLDLAVGDFRLQSSSPCINAGLNGYAPPGPDLEGNPRIAGGTVDIGAYEFQSPSSVLSYAWAQQYGLATDGTADYSDSDSDLMNNWQEWIAGTIPTDALSALRMSEPVIDVSGNTLSWQSVGNRTYFVERSANLGAMPSFFRLISDIPGQEGATTYTDSSAVGSGPFFYRVGVQE